MISKSDKWFDFEFKMMDVQCFIEVARRISELPYLEAEDFANQILIAEGMNPEYEKQWKRKISNKFIEKFGSEYKKTTL